MKPVERPPNRLPIRNEQVKLIETEFLLAIDYPSHQAVNGKRRDTHWTFVAGRLDYRLGCLVHINDINQNAENTAFPCLAHLLPPAFDVVLIPSSRKRKKPSFHKFAADACNSSLLSKVVQSPVGWRVPWSQALRAEPKPTPLCRPDHLRRLPQSADRSVRL